MKPLYILLSFFLTSVAVHSQWSITYTSNQQQRTPNIHLLEFPDTTHGYAYVTIDSWPPPTQQFLIRTNDLGTTWDTVALTSDNYRYLKFFDPNTGVFVLDSSLQRSIDGGSTWNPGPSLNCDCQLFVPQISSAGTGYLLGYRTGVNDSLFVYKTNDLGATWNLVNHFESPVNWSYNNLIYLDQSHPHFLMINDSTYVTTMNGTAFRTSDYGNSWSVTPSSLGGTELRGFRAITDSLIHGYGYFNKVYKSYDQGLTWDSLSLPGNVSVTSVLFYDDSIGYIATHTSGNPLRLKFLSTKDGGTTWVGDSLMSLPTSMSVLEVVDAKRAFATTTVDVTGAHPGIILRTLNGGISEEGDPVGIQRQWNGDKLLVDAYPNPAQSILTIRWDQQVDAVRSPSVLRIYNVIGQSLLSKPIDLSRSAQRIDLDVSQFDSGVYFYRLEGNTGVTTGTWIKQ